MLIPVLILISFIFFFLGFIIKQDAWGVGNYVAKDDKNGQCNIGYWITLIGVVMLIITLVLYRVKKTAKTVRNSASSAYGSARNSASSAYGSARKSASSAYGSARKSASSMFKSKSTPAPSGVEMKSFR